MADALRASPVKHQYMQNMADFLRKARDFGDYAVPLGERSVMDPGGLGSILLGQSPEEAERIAYGNYPLKTQYKGISGKLPELQESRKAPALDLASSLPLGVAGAGLKAGGFGAMAAVRGAKGGGHWTPLSQKRMSALLTGGGYDEGPAQENIRKWLDTMVPRYFQKHAGTESDPARTLDLGTEQAPEQYEKLMDRSLRKSKYEDLPEDDRPAMGRPGEDVWAFNPRQRLADFLRHAGDRMHTLEPDVLARTDIPSLLRRVWQEDRQQVKTTSKNADLRAEAAQKITAEHPGGPFIASPEASWYKFDKDMDPEAVKRGLSVDTCIGEHCIASTGHGKPQWGYPEYVPVRDITTGKSLMDLYPNANLQDSSGYIDSILKGSAEGYSLRDPKGQPLGTAFSTIRPPHTVSRSRMRDEIMNPRDYLAWQRAQREAGVDLEQQVPLPGGGFMVPPRGELSINQLPTILQMYPKYADAITKLMTQRVKTLDQIKGRRNRGVPPEYTSQVVDLLGKAGLAPEHPYTSIASIDLMHSGVGTLGSKGLAAGKGPPVTIQELLAENAANQGTSLTARMDRQALIDEGTMGKVENLLKEKGRQELTQEESSAMAIMIRLLMQHRDK